MDKANYFSRAILAVLAVLTLTGCVDRNMNELEKWTKEQYRNQKPEVEPLPIIPPHETFAYNATNLPNPFANDNLQTRKKQDVCTTCPTPDFDRRKEPLEQYPLDSLAMVGTLFKDETSWVILRAPDGTIHRAKEGNHVGQNFGEIVVINEEKIDVKELVQGPNGDWVERDAGLAADTD